MQIRYQDRKRQSKGEYDAITDRAGCAYTLIDHLREVSRNEHFEATPSGMDLTAGVKTLIGKIQRQPEDPKAIGENDLSPAMLAEDLSKFLHRRERLPSGVSYIDLPGFPPPEFGAGAAAASAMNGLDDTSTFIFDFLNRLKSSGKFESLRQRRAGV